MFIRFGDNFRKTKGDDKHTHKQNTHTNCASVTFKMLQSTKIILKTNTKQQVTLLVDLVNLINTGWWSLQIPDREL